MNVSSLNRFLYFGWKITWYRQKVVKRKNTNFSTFFKLNIINCHYCEYFKQTYHDNYLQDRTLKVLNTWTFFYQLSLLMRSFLYRISYPLQTPHKCTFQEIVFYYIFLPLLFWKVLNKLSNEILLWTFQRDTYTLNFAGIHFIVHVSGNLVYLLFVWFNVQLGFVISVVCIRCFSVVIWHF